MEGFVSHRSSLKSMNNIREYIISFLNIDNLSSWVKIYALIISTYAIIVSAIGVIPATKKRIQDWKTRHLRKVWGIKKGDNVLVICSELDDPEKRQFVKDLEINREFIYNLKYGDVDAYFEVVVTILRLFPKIKLCIMSAKEVENTRTNLLDKHLILIGGPDYNSTTAMILEKKITRYQYKSLYVEERSKSNPDEIVLYDTLNDKEFCEKTNKKDYGYFERVKNPNNTQKKIILIGGCHTIGVTGAVKAFSMFESEQGEIPSIVLTNAKKVAKKISKNCEFSVLVSVERVGQTINVPIVEKRNIIMGRCKEEVKKAGTGQE